MTDDRSILDPSEGDLPSPEFVDDLWERLDAAWDSRAHTDETPRSTPTDPPPTAVDLAVFDERNVPMDSNKRWAAIAAAAAAIIIVIIGVVVITSDDDPDETDIGVVDQPDTDQDDVLQDDAAPPEQPEPADDTETTDEETPDVEDDATEDVPDEDPPSLDIEFTLIDVENSGDVAPGEDYAWVSGRDAPVLTKIDLATNEIVATIDMPTNGGIAVAGFGSAWVNHSDGTVSRYDAETDELQAVIDVGGQPSWIDAGEETVWVSTGSGQEIVRIDPTTNEVVARIDLDDNSGVAMEGAGGFWTQVGSGTIARIDPATNTVIATVETMGLGFGVGPNAVWSGSIDTGALKRIDPATNSVGAEIEIPAPDGTKARAGGAEVGGGWAWVRYTYECDIEPQPCWGLARVDTSTDEVVATAPLPPGFSPGFLTIKAGPTTAWISAEGQVARVDY